MAGERSPILKVRAQGTLACFTRPELKVERVSYPVMTPSAARGLLEAIFWKPAIQWHITRILVLKDIAFTAFRRNEVNSKALKPRANTVVQGGPAPLYFADEDRAQRNTVALKDVDYVIEAWFTITDKVGPDDNMNKFIDMFTRRVAKGQHFHHPYLGCREFVADILSVENAPQPIMENRDLGLMLWDIIHDKKENIPVFFAARLSNGVLEVPPDAESARASIATGEGGAE